MKHLVALFLPVCLVAFKATAQSTHGAPPKASFVTGLPTISLKDINSNIGKFVQINDVVCEYRVLDTLEIMAFGAAYPNQALTVVLYGKAFKVLKASNILGKTVVVSGVITVNKEGKDPEMAVSDPNWIHVY